MVAERDSGIDVIGTIQWGAHFCAFYKTREDLVDILVPYFAAGLENNEFCVCFTSGLADDDWLIDMLAAAVPDFGEYVRRGQIEAVPYSEFFIDGVFDSERAIAGLLES